MPIYEEEPVRRRVVEEPVVERRVVEEPVQQRVVRDSPQNDGLANYALVKYGFILVMTIIILYFLANYILPRLP
ncbi:MAG TPA: hypothetical protein VEU28_04250 [Actinomycetota bacterium]|nr:hypothetical protein [Actinomycetota bacterium]